MNPYTRKNHTNMLPTTTSMQSATTAQREYRQLSITHKHKPVISVQSDEDVIHEQPARLAGVGAKGSY